MEVDWFLVIVILVFVCLTFFVGFYMVLYFQHPEDKNTSYFSKLIVTLSLGVSAMNVLMLPLDTLNRSTGSTIRVDYFCWGFTLASAAFAFIIIPYTMNLYENFDDDECESPYCSAVWSLIPYLIFIAIFIGILSFVANRCEIPIIRYSSEIVDSESALNAGTDSRSLDTFWYITPSMLTFIIAMCGFLGYILLILFGGIGFITLPFNLIQFFVNRPQPINLQQYVRGQQALNRWATELSNEGNSIIEEGKSKSFNTRAIKRRMNKFENQLEYLENAYQVIEVSYKVRGGNPIVPYLSLFAGIIGILITIIWIIHIVFYYILDMHPMLNSFLTILDNFFPFAALIAFGLLVYYLYWCVLSGAVNFGMNFLVIKVHPLEESNTPMTSLLFNTIVMLFASFGVSLFSTMNFSIYTRLTSLEMIYGTQVQTLVGIKYVWQYGVYAMLGILGLSFLYKMCTLSSEKEDRIGDIKHALAAYDTSLHKQ